MQNAGTVLDVLRERGRRGLPLDELYRQLFNPQLYLLAYGRIYSNKGAMTPGATGETADGMSLGKIGRIIDALRHERYRWSPAKRIYIPKKNGKQRPLGLPPWSDKLVGEVVRLLLEAYYEPSFSGRSYGFRPGRGCHTALREVASTWTGTTWFIEGDIADCFGSLDHQIMLFHPGCWACHVLVTVRRVPLRIRKPLVNEAVDQDPLHHQGLPCFSTVPRCRCRPGPSPMWQGSSAATGRRGSRWRKLNPGQQALLVLVYLRKGETFAEIAAGFGVGTTTAWRYAGETVACWRPGRRSCARPPGRRRRPGTPTLSWTGRSSPSTGSPRTGRSTPVSTRSMG